MATIKDVARAAGVSVTTVSHVFSGRRKVAPSTIETVRKVADRLGYSPSGTARSLATGKPTTVGLHFEMGQDALLLNPFFAELLRGLAAAAVDYGFTFQLLPRGVETPIDPETMIGAVIVDPSPRNPWLPYLMSHGRRVVTIGRYLGDFEVSWVDSEIGQGMWAMTGHLREQGYEKLALISVRHGASYTVDLETAFRDSCDEVGLRGEIAFATDLSDRTSRHVAMGLLQRPDRPDAIIGAIDHMALGVLHAAQELGYVVPGDVGVAGFDDTVLARHSVPPLTSVRVFPEDLGAEALRLMHRFWLDPSLPEEQKTLPTELIIRASSDRTSGRA